MKTFAAKPLAYRLRQLAALIVDALTLHTLEKVEKLGRLQDEGECKRVNADEKNAYFWIAAASGRRRDRHYWNGRRGHAAAVVKSRSGERRPPRVVARVDDAEQIARC